MPTLTLLLLSTALAGIPTTFRGIEFGSACSTNPVLEYESTDGEGPDQLVAYHQVQQNLRIGPAPLKSLTFVCWEDKLMSVGASFEPRYGPRLLGGVSALWGSPYQGNQYVDSYVWRDDVTVVLSYEGTGDGALTFIHTDMKNRWQEAQRKADRERVRGDL